MADMREISQLIAEIKFDFAISDRCIGCIHLITLTCFQWDVCTQTPKILVYLFTRHNRPFEESIDIGIAPLEVNHVVEADSLNCA